MSGLPSKHVAALAVLALLLVGCVGKLHLGTTQAIDATPVFPGASLTQTVRIDADGAFGEGLQTSAQTPTFSSGWSVVDGSAGGTRSIVATRRFSGDAIYALPDEPEMVPFLGHTAIRITDYVIARKIEVRIGASPPFSFAGEADQLTRGLAQLVLSGVTVDHTVLLPGILLGGNGAQAAGGGMVWHLDLSSAQGEVLTAESLYFDWPRSALLLLAVAVTVIALRLRRRRNAAPVSSEGLTT